MTTMLLDEKWLAAADFGPAVLRLRLLEVQLLLNRANLPTDIRARALKTASDLRLAIASRPCDSRADMIAKLSLLLDPDMDRTELSQNSSDQEAGNSPKHPKIKSVA